MRITGGNLKGWVIPAKFASHVRPSTDRMRESLFNSLIHQVGIEGKTVLDLFSGSGIIAAEFLSRGAEAVVSVDMDGKNINCYIVYDTDNFWAIELTSGMEKFVSSLAIRTALINVSSLPRPNFLAIDEGFGVLDSDNLNSIFNLFE